MTDYSAAFLNLTDAAKHISQITGKVFSEAMLLQLAMESAMEPAGLKISVILDTPTWVNECEIVTYDRTKLNAEITQGIYTKNLQWREWNGSIERASPCLGDNKYLNVYNRFTSLHGIFDLPFFGDAWITVENKFWELSGNQKTDRPARYGVYLEDSNGNIFRLRDIKPGQKEKLPDNALLVVKKANLDKYLSTQDDKEPSNENKSCGTKANHKLIDRAFYSLNKHPDQIDADDVLAAIRLEWQNKAATNVIDTEYIVTKIESKVIYWQTSEGKEKPMSFATFQKCINKLKKL